MPFRDLLTESIALYRRHGLVLLAWVLLLAGANELVQRATAQLSSRWTDPMTVSAAGSAFVTGLSMGMQVVLIGPLYYWLWLFSLNAVSGRGLGDERTRSGTGPHPPIGPFMRLYAAALLIAFVPMSAFSWVIGMAIMVSYQFTSMASYPWFPGLLYFLSIFQAVVQAVFAGRWILTAPGVLDRGWGISEALRTSWRWTGRQSAGGMIVWMMAIFLWPLAVQVASSAIPWINTGVGTAVHAILTTLHAPLLPLAGALVWRRFESQDTEETAGLGPWAQGPDAPPA